VGDLLAILAFVTAGEIRHNVDVTREPLIVLDTAVPFIAGWLLVGWLVGAFASVSVRSRREMVIRTLLAWPLGAAIAQLLRATSLFRGSADLTFFVVSVVVGLLAVLLARFAVGALLE